jgi:hypothetical protein
MAKRKRRQPQPQARPSGRKLWEQQEDSLKRLAASPALRELQAQIRQFQDSPVGRSLIEANRRLRESPLGRKLIEDALRMIEWQERMRQPEPEHQPQPEPAPRKKIGGGRKQILTAEEIERLQNAYHAAYRDNPKRKQSAVFDDLRKLLGRKVSNTTLREYIVPPRPRK